MRTRFVSRLKNAEADGLDPNDYPSKRLATLSATGPSTDKRGLAIIELYFSSAFLEYASDLKVGRFLPSKIDPNFFIESRALDQLAALKDLEQPIASITFSISGSRQVSTTRHFACLAQHGQFPPKAVGALSRWETLFGRVRPTRVCLPFVPDFR